ncbi:PilZ domain-containing protein [Oleidesulfovibrio sp.]|uniref:PilZ domain-containing protein n=1 Tax=Oleidesulfovibrio sp. TaxID=2909707 RepID=UPI003A899BB2
MEDRRKYDRVYLSEYDYDYPCYIQYGDAEYSVKLLDISQGGARFYMEYGQMPAYQYSQGTIMRMAENSPYYMKNVSYNVAWQYGNEFGVTFSQPLSTSYTALQQDMAPHYYYD